MSDDQLLLSLRKAQGLVDLGRHREAARMLAGFLGQVPDHAPAWCLLADCHDALGAPAQALLALDQALRADPQSADAWRRRGMVLVQCERLDEAVESAREAVRIDPEDFAAHLVLAVVLAARPDGLCEAYQAALRGTELAPQEPQAHYVLGRVAHAQGHAEIGERAYRTALSLQPDLATARTGLGTLGWQAQGWRERGREPLRHFAAALAADPQDADARLKAEAHVLGLLGRGGWCAVLCLFIAAASDGFENAAARPAGAALVLAVSGWWMWRSYQGLPELLRSWTVGLIRRSTPVRVAAAGVAVGLLCAPATLATSSELPGLGMAEFLAGLVSSLAMPVIGALLLRRRTAARARYDG